MKKINPIEMSVPSIFFVGTPFQVLCSIEAIYMFRISDYRFLLVLDSSPRNEQLFNLLDEFHIQYEILSTDYTITKLDRFKAFIPRFNKYKNIYLGDAKNELLKFYAFRYGANGSQTIYLDDGTSTISFLKGRIKLGKKLTPYYQMLQLLRNIKFNKTLFTIYSDIENKNYNIIANNFNYLSTKQEGKTGLCNIFIVGTTTSTFYASEERLIENLENLFISLRNKYPAQDIIYVPHGRDESTRWKEVCEKCQVKIVRPKVSIEHYLMSLSYVPMEVYGYTSSALYSIKMLFPKSCVYNILFENENTPKNYFFISDYFSKHGIVKLSTW